MSDLALSDPTEPARGIPAVRAYLMSLRAAADKVLQQIDHCLDIEQQYSTGGFRRLNELEARIRNDELTAGAFVLDPSSRTLRHGARVHALTPSQFLVMHALMRAGGRPVTREELNAVAGVRLGRNARAGRSLDQQILFLRKMIEEVPSRPNYLLTVRHLGFRFVYGEDEAANRAGARGRKIRVKGQITRAHVRSTHAQT